MKHILYPFTFFSILTTAFSSYGMENKDNKIIKLAHDRSYIFKEDGYFIIDPITKRKMLKIGDRCDSIITDKNKQTIVIYRSTHCFNISTIGIYDTKTNHLKNIQHIDGFYPMTQYESHTINDIAFYPYDNNIIGILSLIDAQHGHSRLIMPNFVHYWDIKREKLIGSTLLTTFKETEAYNLSFSSDGKNIMIDQYRYFPVADRVNFVKRNIFRWWCLKIHQLKNPHIPNEIIQGIITTLHRTYES